MKRWCIRALGVLGLALVALFVENSSWLARPPDHPYRWLSHRGIHQTFDPDGVDSDTCTATLIRPPTHLYIENTLVSMEAAFDVGATAVELDLHGSSDGHLVVFHDHSLECRTDGHGAPEDLTLEALKKLDLGYGYTADGGKTHPLRGHGIGLMPELSEVLDAFPDEMLVLHIKTDLPEHGTHLADILEGLSPERRAKLVVYGGDRPTGIVQERLPDVRTFDPHRVKDCLKGYALTGWFGRVPPACAHTMVLVPISHARWLWGWPARFERRMEAADSEVVLVGPYEGSPHLAGVDTPEWFARVPSDFGGYVWTNRIEVAPR